jgi:hypothetical protein
VADKTCFWRLRQGPWQPSEIESHWATLRAEFPNATIRPSTFDTYFALLATVKQNFPVITSELAGAKRVLADLLASALLPLLEHGSVSTSRHLDLRGPERSTQEWLCTRDGPRLVGCRMALLRDDGAAQHQGIGPAGRSAWPAVAVTPTTRFWPTSLASC